MLAMLFKEQKYVNNSDIILEFITANLNKPSFKLRIVNQLG